PLKKVETVILFRGEIDWSTTICKEKIDSKTYSIGLISKKSLAKDLGYKIWKKKTNKIIGKWGALKTYVNLCVGQLPSPKRKIPDWMEKSKKCAEDLINCNECRIKIKNIEGHPAYVKKGHKVNNLELMTQSDVAWPLLVMIKKYPYFRKYKAWADHLVKILPNFFDKEEKVFLNSFPLQNKKQEKISETWYLMENYIKILEIVKLTKDKKLKNMCKKEAEEIIEIAKEVDYLFPLFFNVSQREKHGTALNYAVAGMYSYAMILCHDIFKDKKYLEESIFSLKHMHGLELKQFNKEPQEIAFAVAASQRLFEMLKEEEYREMRDDFLRASLRMLYIVGDNSGLFHGFTWGYPAYKENVESILPWANFLKKTKLPLIKIINLQLIKNHEFFDENTPHIPFESKKQSEGKEIYGAGETFWLAMLQERLKQKSKLQRKNSFFP
ncbi:hypothetical protein KAH94_06570, partial [bacterium]|nr:hypothetical protein [bacterium]